MRREEPKNLGEMAIEIISITSPKSPPPTWILW